MSLRVKNIIYSALLLLVMFLVYKYRASQTEPLVAFSGKTMGPIIYNVKYFDEALRDFQPEVDSLLNVFNLSLNTYIPQSEISRFNRGESFRYQLPYFYEAINVSREVFDLTQGAFDPSIGPLINTWGFGYTEGVNKDSAVIDSIRMFIGMEKILFNKDSVWKKDPRVALDFSASAKGYGVDVVFEYLKNKGLTDIFVEIGGEVRVGGENRQTGKPWQVGILHPNSDELNRYPMAIVSLSDQAMATSGNYFNYHIIDGIKYSHTISPDTGYPIQHPLLSATVFADDCMRADALATALMVLGHEKAIALIESQAQYEGFLIYNDEKGQIQTYSSPGVASKIKLID